MTKRAHSKSNTGRPERKGPPVKIYLTAEERAILDARRKQAGYKTTSRFLRDRILNKQSPTSRTAISFDNVIMALNKSLRIYGNTHSNFNQIVKRSHINSGMHPQDAARIPGVIDDIMQHRRETAAAIELIVDIASEYYDSKKPPPDDSTKVDDS
ncbi:MAG: hypothetical protein AAGD43_04940 [Pseudomonadota bacterium]